MTNAADIPLYDLPVFERKERDLARYGSSPLVTRVQQAFDDLLARDAVVAHLVHTLQETRSTAVVFGGWVRDQLIGLIHDNPVEFRDIDLVVHGPAALQIRDLVPSSAHENIFGGFTFPTTTTGLDIWPLANTYLIAKRQLPVNFETLPGTTVFRINSVVFFPSQIFGTPRIVEAGCVSAVKSRRVDFQSEQVPFPDIQVARSVIYAAKLQFTLAPEVKSFVKTICSTTENLQQVDQGLQQFCPAQWLEAARAHLLHALGQRTSNQDTKK